MYHVHIAICHYDGMFKNCSDVFPDLRIYGALVSATQLQFCVLFETNPQQSVILDNPKSSIVFQTSTQYCLFDLNGLNPWNRAHVKSVFALKVILYLLVGCSMWKGKLMLCWLKMFKLTSKALNWN
jgi:hypothetical protein